MRRAGLALAAAIMAAGTLTACGGGSDEFCEVGSDLETSDFTEGGDKAKDALDEAVDTAPDDVKGDVETLRDGYEAAMAAQDGDTEAAADIDMDALTEANENVQTYVDENCD